jgi:hypothetical protein
VGQAKQASLRLGEMQVDRALFGGRVSAPTSKQLHLGVSEEPLCDPLVSAGRWTCVEEQREQKEEVRSTHYRRPQEKIIVVAPRGASLSGFLWEHKRSSKAAGSRHA